jgi:uncharacterized membrane protein YcaP (DUF421 family)
MGAFGPVDWNSIFVPDTPLLEIIVRGTLVYLALFALLRFVLKRQSGAVGVTDLLVVVLIADAAQNAMAHDYKSVPDGILLVAVIVGWSYALDWLGYRFPRMGRLLHPPPLLLVREGQMLRRNMRQELVTQDELMSQLREQGIDDLSKVKRACMEGDGKISVVTREGDQHPPTKKAAM